jgi:hypothetical protein
MKTKKPILTFTLKGNCIWGNTKGLVCEVYGFYFKHKNKSLDVEHNLTWDIYTDKTFEKEITKYVKKEFPNLKIKSIVFSEQGLQKNKEADMDVLY